MSNGKASVASDHQAAVDIGQALDARLAACTLFNPGSHIHTVPSTTNPAPLGVSCPPRRWPRHASLAWGWAWQGPAGQWLCACALDGRQRLPGPVLQPSAVSQGHQWFLATTAPLVVPKAPQRIEGVAAAHRTG